MSDRHNIDTARHRSNRGCLRVIGPVVFLTGLVLTIIGMAGFFSAFGSGPSFGGPPPGVRLFFLAFIGIPLMGVGGAITKFAYMGSVFRYIAGETAPVAKDTANYMVEGTKDAIGGLAQSVGAGLSAGLSGEAPEAGMIPCPACDNACDPGARFCDQCGAKIPGPVRCPSCGEMNDPDARFCSQCGQATGA